MSPIIVDLWVFYKVADSLENGCFTCVGPANDENPELSKLLSEIFDWHCVGERDKKSQVNVVCLLYRKHR